MKTTTRNLILLLLGVILICIIPIIVYKTSSVPKLRETFVSLAPDFLTQDYKLHGIDKCDVLNDQSLEAQSFLGTLRLRKWKPTRQPGSIDNAEDSKFSYCYYYNDSDPSKIIYKGDQTGDLVQDNRKLSPISDPLSAAASHSCSKNDSDIFRDAPFIADAFRDASPEMTLHPSLSYDKCVLKIDKTKITPSALSEFWSKAAGPNITCAALYNAFMKEQRLMQERLEAIIKESNDVKSMYEAIMAQEQAYRQANNVSPPSLTWQQIKNDLETCRATNNMLIETIRNEQTILDEANAYMLKYVDESTNSYNTTLRALDDVDRDIASIQGRIQGLTDQRTFYTNEVNRITQQLSMAETQLASCSKTRSDLDANLLQLNKRLQETQADLSQLERTMAALTTQREDLQKQVAQRQANIAQMQAIYADRERPYQQCLASIPQAEENANTWFARMKDVTSQYDYCVQQRAPIIAEIEQLQKEIDILNVEIEEIKKHCMRAESDILIQGIDAAKIHSQNMAQTSQVNCEFKKRLTTESTILDEEISSLNSQVLRASGNQKASCTEIKAKCPCPTVKIYRDCRPPFKDLKAEYGPGEYNGVIGKDSVSGIQFTNLYRKLITMTLHSGENFSGDSILLSGADIPCLDVFNWNDRANSFKIQVHTNENEVSKLVEEDKERRRKEEEALRKKQESLYKGKPTYY